MKTSATISAAVAGIVLVIGAFWVIDDSLAPLFLNSRIERLGEKNLPRILVEKKNTIYCRMKADDFRFPLPPGSHAINPVATGGFDSVDGIVEARFVESNHFTADQYNRWLSGKIPDGGQITSESIPGGILIKFHYFGDR